MPELPDLEAMAGVLRRRIGQTVLSAETPRPPVICTPAASNFAALLTGATLLSISRRGRYLLCRWHPPTSHSPDCDDDLGKSRTSSWTTHSAPVWATRTQTKFCSRRAYTHFAGARASRRKRCRPCTAPSRRSCCQLYARLPTEWEIKRTRRFETFTSFTARPAHFVRAAAVESRPSPQTSV